MKIAIDIRKAIGKRLGKGVFTLNIIKHLLRIDQKNEYLLLTDEDLDDETNAAFLANRNANLWICKSKLWHIKAKRKMIMEKADVFFAPTSFITAALLPDSIRSIVAVHDLISFLFPKEHQTKATLIEKIFLGRALKKASHIITVSENTKKDLIKFFPFAAAKPITVIYPAASETFSEDIPREALEKFRKEKNLPEDFLLAVGTIEPRKNLEILLSLGENTVIVGSEGWKNKNLMKKFRETRKHTRLLPYLPEKDLAKIYRLAKAFVFPSKYEGFGIPVLEAMASGCPVICSNTSSLPEAGGESALFFDPKNTEDLRQCVAAVKNTAEKNAKTDFSARGKEQAKKFSWRESAEKLKRLLET